MALIEFIGFVAKNINIIESGENPVQMVVSTMRGRTSRADYANCVIRQDSLKKYILDNDIKPGSHIFVSGNPIDRYVRVKNGTIERRVIIDVVEIIALNDEEDRVQYITKMQKEAQKPFKYGLFDFDLEALIQGLPLSEPKENKEHSDTLLSF